MAAPPQVGSATPPAETPLSPDMRYVLVELGKIATSIAWLTDEVKQLKNGQQMLRQGLSKIEGQIIFVNGALCGVVGMLLVGGYLVNGKIDALAALIKTLAK